MKNPSGTKDFEDIYTAEKIFVHGDSLIAVLTVPEEYYKNLNTLKKKKLDVMLGVLNETIWYIKIDSILLLFLPETIKIFDKNPVIYIYVFNSNSYEEYVSITYNVDKESLLKISGIMEYLKNNKVKKVDSE